MLPMNPHGDPSADSRTFAKVVRGEGEAAVLVPGSVLDHLPCLSSASADEQTASRKAQSADPQAPEGEEV